MLGTSNERKEQPSGLDFDEIMVLLLHAKCLHLRTEYTC